MFTNILVPIDFSEHNARAIRTAIDIASASGGKVRLFHVIEPIPGVDVEEDPDFFQRLEERATRVLAEHGSAFRDSGIEWDSEIVYGPRAWKIVQRAEEMECDLILVSSHRVRPETPGAGWGTLSYQVAILADCPVLLVK